MPPLFCSSGAVEELSVGGGFLESVSAISTPVIIFIILIVIFDMISRYP
jgi:hypothetical protein